MSLCPELTLIKLIECGTSEVTIESYCDNAEQRGKEVAWFILLYIVYIIIILEQGDL